MNSLGLFDEIMDLAIQGHDKYTEFLSFTQAIELAKEIVLYGVSSDNVEAQTSPFATFGNE